VARLPRSPTSPAPTSPATLTLDARRKRRRREQFGKPHTLPLQLEIAFGKRIDALFERLATKAQSIAVGRVRQLTQDAPPKSDHQGLARELEAAIDFGAAEAAVLVGKVANQNARQMRRALRALRPADETKSVAVVIPELSPKNVRRLAHRTVKEIDGIADAVAKRVESIVRSAVSRGLRGEAFAKELEHELGIEKKAAQRIAVGQVIRINSAVTQQRHEALGITEYIWRSVPDQHTRRWHRELNGTRQRYDSPPMGGGGGPKDHGNPGSADVCRCQALPVLT